MSLPEGDHAYVVPRDVSAQADRAGLTSKPVIVVEGVSYQTTLEMVRATSAEGRRVAVCSKGAEDHEEV